MSESGQPPNQEKESFVLVGTEEQLKGQIPFFLALRQLLKDKEIGEFLGYPLIDYVRVERQELKLIVRFESNKNPPWRIDSKTYLPRPTYSIPFADRTKIKWKTIKDACGGENGYEWGNHRATGLFEGGNQMQVLAKSNIEAKNRLQTLAALSTKKLIRLTDGEDNISDAKGALKPAREARRVYPAFVTIINNRENVRNKEKGIHKIVKPKSVRIPLYTESEPPDAAALIAEVLSNTSN